MNGKRFAVAICALAFLSALSVARADEAAGVVTEMGFNKIAIKDKAGALRQLTLSQGDTKFDPDTWRPAEGDAVIVTFTQQDGRRGPVLTASLVKLGKAGPNSIANLKSPIVVSVTESGKTGIKATLPDGKAIKFTRHSGTVYTPAGWVPASGEKARVVFRIQPARLGYGLTYLADTIEKAN